MPARISKTEFQQEVLDSELSVLVDFYSDSCIPCKRIAPVLSQLEQEYSGKVKFLKINVNFEKELVEEYHILSAPTIVLFSKGQEISRLKGAVKKDEVIALISQIL